MMNELLWNPFRLPQSKFQLFQTWLGQGLGLGLDNFNLKTDIVKLHSSTSLIPGPFLVHSKSFPSI